MDPRECDRRERAARSADRWGPRRGWRNRPARTASVGTVAYLIDHVARAATGVVHEERRPRAVVGARNAKRPANGAAEVLTSVVEVRLRTRVSGTARHRVPIHRSCSWPSLGSRFLRGLDRGTDHHDRPAHPESRQEEARRGRRRIRRGHQGIAVGVPGNSAPPGAPNRAANASGGRPPAASNSPRPNAARRSRNCPRSRLAASPVRATTLVAASVENPGGRSRVAGSASSGDADVHSGDARAVRLNDLESREARAVPAVRDCPPAGSAGAARWWSITRPDAAGAVAPARDARTSRCRARPDRIRALRRPAAEAANAASFAETTNSPAGRRRR